MSGHSKWASIRRKKEKIDSARGRVFSRLIKEISVAARLGGGDEMGNPRLRSAIEAAKAANMPAANIERAIKKGTGELPGISYEEVTYEAYGPGGTALLIDVMTDNRNRTLNEVRHIIAKYGGNMGEAGSVGWMFKRLGLISIPASGTDEDSLILSVIEAGGDDVKLEDDYFQVTTPPEALGEVRTALVDAEFAVESAALAQIPQTYIPVDGTKARQLLKLLEALEEHDDVQDVWSNFDITDELLQNA